MTRSALNNCVKETDTKLLKGQASLLVCAECSWHVL